MRNLFEWTIRGVAIAVIGAAIAGAAGGGSASAAGAVGAVYTLTNEAAGNRVAVFDRGADGALTAAGTYATGGLGTGGGLGSQGAVILTDNDRFLLAVNAGSDDISSFRVDHDGLTLVDTVASGGDRPIGLTAHGDLVYVVNAGGSGNISGFTLGADGDLTPIAGSTRPLTTAASGPAQVEFSPDGGVLAVTEKATNVIGTYTVDGDGIATGPVSHASAGATPFGFAFGKRGDLIVSEAFGGAPGASAVSSYDMSPDGGLTTITASAATGQTAACWIAISGNGKFAYTTNTGSGSVTGYRIGNDGALTILDAGGVTGSTGAGTAPIDLDFSRNSRFLYVLNGSGGGAEIDGFAAGSDGSLTPVATATGLPGSSVGLAVR